MYVGSTRIGAVKRSYGGRWDVYEGYSKVGYCTGTGGAVGGAAFLLLMLGG